MRFWYTNYESKDLCMPHELNKLFILRNDNVIIQTKEEIEEVCWNCMDKKHCIATLKRLKTEFYSNLKANEKTDGWVR